ncbi:MAG TPA: FAD:protein FMN transferase [Aggregatilinea sp.]|uniref:FAD:protein FMN transferase n=1 Tax=Aggregatilinea sp. TaxID=2806333 RepID=UPI002C159BA6|nr:FAD:protein FMN transferase [Aggregatilinea sp.]HML22398.1 FAD:protein FMN transferase [Aggregatilinea sp.]
MSNPESSALNKTRFSRRQFIKITALAGGVVALGGVGLDLARSPGVQRVQETCLLLGTVANLTVISDDPGTARAAIRASFERMAALEGIFSRFRADSQLTALNTTGRLDAPDPALRDVLARAVEYGDLTGGAFDVTVEPVLALYRARAVENRLPDADELARAEALVDYRRIALSADRITLDQPGMAVTLDGIAKGYIIDTGAAVFVGYGFDRVMVELGGDMQALGSAGSRPWQVGIQPPRAGDAEFAAVTQIDNRALATSGDYMNTFTPDFRLNHILDPHTGASPLALSSASVIAPTACDADALATAMMVLGPVDGLALVERLVGVEALLIAKDGSVTRSSGFPEA